MVVVSAATGDGLAELRRLLASAWRRATPRLARLDADVARRGRRLRGACAGGARPGSGARTARGSSPRSRRRPASRPSSAPSPTPTGGAGRSRPAGRSSAGCSASGPTRCAGCGCPRRRRRRSGRRCRRRPTCSARRSTPPRGGSPTAPRRACPSRGRGSSATAATAADDAGRRPPRPCRRRHRPARLAPALVARRRAAPASPRASPSPSAPLWLLVLAVLGYLRIEDVVPLPEVARHPDPDAGSCSAARSPASLVGFLARLVNGVGAGRRARRPPRGRFAPSVERVADELVVAPVEAELDARARLRAAVEAASGPRSDEPALEVRGQPRQRERDAEEHDHHRRRRSRTRGSRRGRSAAAPSSRSTWRSPVSSSSARRSPGRSSCSG